MNELGTDPLNTDSDGDGFGDCDEALVFDTDPIKNESFPKMILEEVVVPLPQPQSLDAGSWGYLDFFLFDAEESKTPSFSQYTNMITHL